MTELYDEQTDAEFEYVGAEKDGSLYEVKSVRNPLEGRDAWLNYLVDLDDVEEDRAGFYTILPVEENEENGREY